MNYCGIKNCDIADGPGVRVTLFVSGCRNRCPGCFQKETWDFDYGDPFDEKAAENVFALLAPSWIRGLTLLGGEPMEPENQRALLPFLREYRRRFPGKDLWIYSGYPFERLLSPGEHPHTECTADILSLADILVDGPFVQSQRDPMLRFRGSANQRILDLPRSLREGRAVHWAHENDRQAAPGAPSSEFR